MKKTLIILLFLIFILGCRFSIPQSNDTTEVETEAAVILTDQASTSVPDIVETIIADEFDLGRLGTTVIDITYCSVNGVALKMDVYYPSSYESDWPVAMYVHGGGWRSGDKTKGIGMQDVVELLKSGFLVVSVNYRLAPEYKFPAMIEDVKCAVRYLRAHAGEYNLDPDHIGVWGSSAGGHLVALLGTSDVNAGWDVGEYLDQSSRVQAVVDMFGPSDFTQKFKGGDAEIQSEVFGMEKYIEDFAKAVSPVSYVSSDDPPFLIMHGAEDTLVPLSQSQILNEQLKLAGVPSELVIVQNAGHGFAPVDGKITSPNRRAITRMMVDFFIETLK
ncbi:MAG: alpha/beta hydrolase fold domain-containing protein [Anaerolineaceae bacterium]